MRRVLVLSYFHPPLGGAGALRTLTLLRRLPAMGYEPVVITGPGETFGRFRPLDASLAPIEGLDVRRIPGPEPERAAGGRLERLKPGPSAWERWLEEGFVQVGRQVPDVDLVYCDMGPDATAFAGARLAAELNVPWVPDLGDPWALDEMRNYPTALHRFVDRRNMRRVMSSAAAVVMNTREAAKALRDAFPEQRDRPVLALPVGFDAGDFEGYAHTPDGDAFRIVHTGSFHTRLAFDHQHSAKLRKLLRGGPDQSVDVLPRSPFYLRKAIDALEATHPELYNRIELHLAGSLTDADREVLAGLPNVHEHGFLTHHETLALIHSADLLFLPMQDVPGGGRVRIVPCKGYEYLAAGRAVLAALPDGDGRDLFERAPAAYVTRPKDVDAMAAAIVAESEREHRHASVAEDRAELIAHLERGYLNRELVRTFDELLGVPATQAARAA
jgi:glycosyltransferase involved in cell wall biosynthesis